MLGLGTLKTIRAQVATPNGLMVANTQINDPRLVPPSAFNLGNLFYWDMSVKLVHCIKKRRDKENEWI